MKVLSFGEVLWDVYPTEKHIGGAPLNFAAHFVKQGGEAYMLSAVGEDDLGNSALSFLKEHGIHTDHVSVSQRKETGKCLVTLDGQGIPNYNLLRDVAYDEIPMPDLHGADFDAFYFGSLALRSERNRETVSEILKNNTFHEVFVDINIRPPFVSEEVIRFACKKATILKISEEEFPTVTKLLFDSQPDATEAAKTIAGAFGNIKIIIITRGANGSFAYDRKNGHSCSCDAVKIKVVSTVGAGDSFSAAFLHGFLSGNRIEDCLRSASKISAFVCSKAEAIPEDPTDPFERFVRDRV